MFQCPSSSHLRLLRTLLRSPPCPCSCSTRCTSSSWLKVTPEPPCIICISASCIWPEEVNTSLCCWVLFCHFCHDLVGAPRGLFPPLIFPLSNIFFFGGEILHLKVCGMRAGVYILFENSYIFHNFSLNLPPPKKNFALRANFC